MIYIFPRPYYFVFRIKFHLKSFQYWICNLRLFSLEFLFIGGIFSCRLLLLYTRRLKANSQRVATSSDMPHVVRCVAGLRNVAKYATFFGFVLPYLVHDLPARTSWFVLWQSLYRGQPCRRKFSALSLFQSVTQRRMGLSVDLLSISEPHCMTTVNVIIIILFFVISRLTSTTTKL